MGGSVGVKVGDGIMRVFVLSRFLFVVSGAVSGLVGSLVAFGSSFGSSFAEGFRVGFWFGRLVETGSVDVKGGIIGVFSFAFDISGA